MIRLSRTANPESSHASAPGVKSLSDVESATLRSFFIGPRR